MSYTVTTNFMLLSYEMEGEGLGDLVTCDDCQSSRQRADT